MRMIDADALCNFIKQRWGDCKESRLFCMVINKSPTVDAVPVVRCKDCKYNNHCFTQEFVFDKNTWFCADGERKDGTADTECDAISAVPEGGADE